MQEQNEVLKLSDWQFEEQLETVYHFLQSVHPHLLSKEGFRPCVELRPINRGEENFMRSKSLMLWDLSPESIERLRAFLARHNGYPSCLFYSVFYYDNLNHKDSSSKKKTAKSSRIHNSAALGTCEVALDFDNLSFEEYIELVDRFEELGIYAIWVFSGHGYQAHILLEEDLEDTDVLRRLVYKFRAKGFACDPACVDPARIMRLPYTYNCKGFSDPVYEEEKEDPPLCKIVQDSATRYPLQAILEKLDSLPTVSVEDEKVSVKGTSKKSSKSSPKKAQPESEDSITVRRAEYPYIDNFDLPDAVNKMLAFTPHGVRNKVLGYLIRLFKTQYKLGKSQILEILSIWANEACEPVYDPDDLNKDFRRLYYEYNGLGYDTELVKRFGPIDHQELITLRKKDILIPNQFIQDFNILDGNLVRLYLAIKMLEHIDVPATVEKLSEVLGLSVRFLRKIIQELIKSRHIFVTKGVRRSGIPDTYSTHRGYSLQEGYTTFSYNDIKAYITELYDNGSRGANGELKLYLFMRCRFNSGDIFMSQEKMGQYIDFKQNTISDIVSRLEQKHFIKIKKVKRYNCFDSCEYTLLR